MAEQQFSRRNFIGSAAIAGAGIAAAGLLSGCSSASTDEGATKAQSSQTWDYEVDVAIAGAGYGGLVAGATAVQEGASSIIVESARRVGGTGLAATLGFGFYTYESFESMSKALPTADLELSKVVWDIWTEMQDWFDENDFPYTENNSLPNYLLYSPRTHEGNVALADAMLKAFEGAGGQVLLETKAVKLYTDEDGAVIGMKALAADGSPINIKAKSVILCNGGFQNNPQMKQQFLGKNGDCVQAQACYYNDGTGIRMGLDVGAILSKDMDGFTGFGYQAYPSILPKTAEEWESAIESVESIDNYTYCVDALDGYGSGIILNTDGKRFVDESLGDGVRYRGVVEERLGLSYIIFDQTLRENAFMTLEDGDAIDFLISKGAMVFTGGTIEELAQNLAAGTNLMPAEPAWSWEHTEANADAVVQTINEYNAAIDAGTTSLLNPPRTGDMNKIENAPFYAVAATAGTYMTCGGLKINNKAEVLGNCNVPIAGLYAAPGTAGGIMGKTAWTVLPLNISFARVAAQSAVEKLG